jgi:hypothetical protein
VSLFEGVPCPRKLSQLRHGDTAKRERRRIITQRDSFQCTEGIALGKRPCRGCNQRIHQNPATLVTPRSFDTCINICTWNKRSIEHGIKNEIQRKDTRDDDLFNNSQN